MCCNVSRLVVKSRGENFGVQYFSTVALGKRAIHRTVNKWVGDISASGQSTCSCVEEHRVKWFEGCRDYVIDVVQVLSQSRLYRSCAVIWGSHPCVTLQAQ